MDYEELIAKAMKGRKTYPLAQAWGMNDMTLRRYVTGERLPDYDTALKLVNEAGITKEEGFEILAAEHRRREVIKQMMKKQQGFVQTGILFTLGEGLFVAILSILCQMDDSAEPRLVVIVFTTQSHQPPHVY
jgi:hypothetical protein